MKKKYYILIVTAFSILGILYISLAKKGYFSREDEEQLTPKIKNITVENGFGEIRIKYQLSDSSLISHIKAEYRTKSGILKTIKASSYLKELSIMGLDSHGCDKVSLYSVTKAGIVSDPVIVKVNPMVSNYQLVYESLTVFPTFDGIVVQSVNKNSEAVDIITCLDRLNNGKYVQIDSHYTKDSLITYKIKNINKDNSKIALLVQDRNYNRSDSLFMIISPLKEQQLNRKLFSDLNLPGDAKSLYNSNIGMIWDGDKNPYKWPSFYTAENDPSPPVISFSVGKKIRLSKLVIYPRRENGFYDKGNLKDFEIWATNKPELNGAWQNWKRLATLHVTKPSGILDNQFTKTDEDLAKQGWTFDMIDDGEAYQYFRIKNISNWQRSLFMQLTQIEFFGI